MIISTDKEYRWKLFESYSLRFITNSDVFALTPREFSDFVYLKHYFMGDFIKAKLTPWLPNILIRKA